MSISLSGIQVTAETFSGPPCPSLDGRGKRPIESRVLVAKGKRSFPEDRFCTDRGLSQVITQTAKSAFLQQETFDQQEMIRSAMRESKDFKKSKDHRFQYEISHRPDLAPFYAAQGVFFEENPTHPFFCASVVRKLEVIEGKKITRGMFVASIRGESSSLVDDLQREVYEIFKTQFFSSLKDKPCSEAVVNAFVDTFFKIHFDPKIPVSKKGVSLLIAFIVEEQCHVASLGSSRALISTKGEDFVQISADLRTFYKGMECSKGGHSDLLGGVLRGGHSDCFYSSIFPAYNVLPWSKESVLFIADPDKLDLSSRDLSNAIISGSYPGENLGSRVFRLFEQALIKEPKGPSCAVLIGNHP